MSKNANPDVAEVLKEAAGFDSVILLGVIEGENHVKVLSTVDYMPDILWAIKSAEMQLMNMGIEYDD